MMRSSNVVIMLFGRWLASLSAQGEPPVFRATADSVTVNVSVKRGNNPVSGLTAADFQDYDNDVLQRIAAVSVDAVPVEVSFVVDMSLSAFPDTQTAREAIRRMAGFLRPGDRFRVVTMGNSVVNAIPWQPAGDADMSRMREAPGHISLVADSVLVALLHRADPARRHLVVALTDGQDICSLASGESLRRAAERSDAVFHWVNTQLGSRSIASYGGVESTCRNPVLGTPTSLSPALSDAARLTGGSVHTARSRADTSGIALFFDAILDDFRRSYLLHYVPEAGAQEGWHRLRLELLGRRKDYTLRARPGYWVDRATASSPTQ
jgi:hypothetical protein